MRCSRTDLSRFIHSASTEACIRASDNSADASTNAGPLKGEYLGLLLSDLQPQPFDLGADELKGHSELKSSGTSPNFLITLASLKSPVAGSPVRLKATAPT